jgi:CHAD domain-containing protein
MAKAADIVGLDCMGDVRAGVALILRTRLAEMCAFRAAALEGADPAGVHDMRVASRRLRSAMRDFAPYLRGQLPRKRLRQLARALGVVRDEEVALSALEEFAREAEPDIESGLRLLFVEHQQRLADARALLTLALEETAVDAMQAKFLKRLAQVTSSLTARAGKKGKQRTARSLREAGREIVLARLAELERASTALYRPHAESRLHRLRIRAKSLRYALELFAACWGEQLATVAAEVAKLQQALGDLHDCDVWIATLGARLTSMQADASDGQPGLRARIAAERRASVWLLESYVKERGKHYRDALARSEEWAAADFYARVHASFTSPDIAALADDIPATEALLDKEE